MKKIKLGKLPNAFINFIFSVFRIKSLSVYKLTLIILVFTSAISVAFVSGLWVYSETMQSQQNINEFKENTLIKQKQKLKDEVLRVINYLEFRSIDTLKNSVEELQNEALNYFKDVRFGNDGYIFINTYDGNALLFDGQKLDIPKNIYNLEDPEGLKIFQKELELVQIPEGGYFNYQFKKIYDTKPQPKLSFVKGFDKWRWIIGTGDYLDNISYEISLMETELNRALLNNFLMVFAVLVSVLFILILISSLVAKSIQNQFDKFVSIIKLLTVDKQDKFLLEGIFIKELKAIGSDIMRAEELSRHFGQIIDQSTNEIYIFDKYSLRFVHANRGAIQNCGYSLNELQKLTPLDLKPELTKNQFLDLINPLMQGEQSQIRFETIHQRKNLSTYPIEVRLTTSVFYQNPVYIAFINDISERKKMHFELESNSNLIEKLLTTIPDLIWLKDIDGVYLKCNPSFENLYGAKEKDIIGKTDYDFVDKELADFFREHDFKALNAGKPTSNEEFLTFAANNYQGWFETTKTPLLNKEGNVIGVLGVARDITERKKAEDELKKHHKHLEELVKEIEKEQNQAQIYLDIASVMFVTLNVHGEIVLINKKGCFIIGYENSDELIGHNWFELCLPKYIKSEVLSVFNKLMAGEIEPVEYYENPILTKSGEERIVAFHNTVLRNSESQITGVLFSGEDITERKKSEIELEKYRSHLEELVKERTAALQKSQDSLLNLVEDLNNQSIKLEKSNTQLAAINEELETFTYSVSHDLKAPLRGIDGYSQLLQESFNKDLDEEAQVFLDNIRKSALQMNVLIEDLLSYSRMEQKGFQSENINFKALVDNLLMYYAKTINENSIEIKLNIPETFLPIADTDGMNLVIRNLFDNAIKFTSTIKKPYIEITAYENEKNWCIFVKDNGIGFDMKYHDKIFKIFQRLHLAEEYEGTGIGLAMVNKAVHRMNGKIWFESKEGKGSTFYFTIPR